MASEQPDVVSLQELNTYTQEKLFRDPHQWGHPYSVLLQDDGFATGITARFPLTDVAKIRDGMHHGLLRCRIQGIRFYVIHFHPSDYARRIEEASLLAKDIQQLGEENPQIILTGDLNGFSPVDRDHYASDPKLVPFFEMLDQRNRNARNLNDGGIDYRRNSGSNGLIFDREANLGTKHFVGDVRMVYPGGFVISWMPVRYRCGADDNLGG